MKLWVKIYIATIQLNYSFTTEVKIINLKFATKSMFQNIFFEIKPPLKAETAENPDENETQNEEIEDQKSKRNRKERRKDLKASAPAPPVPPPVKKPPPPKEPVKEEKVFSVYFLLFPYPKIF